MSVYDLYDEHVLQVYEYVYAQHNMLMFTVFVFIIIIFRSQLPTCLSSAVAWLLGYQETQQQTIPFSAADLLPLLRQTGHCTRKQRFISKVIKQNNKGCFAHEFPQVKGVY